MLIEFTVKNYRSFADEVTLSMLPNTKLTEHKEHLIDTGIKQVPHLLRSAVIYGANASGKSNLHRAFRVMQNMVENSHNSNLNHTINVSPFKLDAHSVNEPTLFSVQCIVNGVRYHYGFAATSERVVEEFLDVYPKGRKQEWFHRSWNSKEYEYKFGDFLKGKKDDNVSPTTLFLSKEANVNTNPQLIPLWQWFSNFRVYARTDKGQSTSKACAEDATRKKVVEFLKDAMIDVDDITLKPSVISETQLPEGIPDSLKEIFLSPDVKFLKINPETKSVVEFDLDADESTGTHKLYALATLWLDVMENGGTIFFDELELHLHPLLQNYLVKKIAHAKTGTAQLIFTTHNTYLMNQDIFRRDQLCFVEMDGMTKKSDLYALSSFRKDKKTPRKGEAIEQNYLEGRYGAVPVL